MKGLGFFRIPIPYRYIWILATLFSLIIIGQTYVRYLFRNTEDPYAWFFFVSTSVTHHFTWALMMPLLYPLSRLYEDRGVFSTPRILTHIFVGILVAGVQGVISGSARALCYGVFKHDWFNPFVGHGVSSYFVSMFSALVEYWVIIAAFVAVDLYNEYRRKEVELVRMENELNNAQLNALKMQLQPHFLFNTLHAISSLMNENVANAQKMVSQLGYLLRSILDQEQKNAIPLREELEYIRSYLDIEEIRFQDRLQIVYDISDDTLDAMVPNLILQPLVENAIKHGFARMTDSGMIRVASTARDGQLTLVVEDNGCGLDDTDTAMEHAGVGLRNIMARLEQMYRGRARFQLERREAGGVIARIVIPLQRSKGSN